jgi:hypothetical protein
MGKGGGNWLMADLGDIEKVLKAILRELESINQKLDHGLDSINQTLDDDLRWYGKGFAARLREELDRIESRLDKIKDKLP